MGAMAAWSGPFSDVPRDSPFYDTFRFLQEQGVLARSLVKLPAEGALTRYEFAVATVDALDFIAALLVQAEVGSEAAASPSPPPEVRRCQAEIRKLLQEFRPELQKLGLDIGAEVRKLDRFLRAVRSLHLSEEPVQPSPPVLPEPPRTVAALPTPPSEPPGRLLAPGRGAAMWRPPRNAAEVQELLDRTRGTFLDPSEPTLPPSSRQGGWFPRELSLRASLGGGRLQVIHAARRQDDNPVESYALYGARATFGLLGDVTAGLTYLRTEAKTGRERWREPMEGEVYGADMRLPMGEYGIYLEYAQSRATDRMQGGGRALEVGFSGPIASDLTIGAAYRTVDASFRLAGGRAGWGEGVDPTNVRGVRFTGDYRPRDGLRLLSSYEHYSPLSASPEPGLDRALANLEYGLNDQTSLSLGYEYVRRLRPAGLSLGEQLERWITAGLALDLSDRLFFRLHYRRSMQEDHWQPAADGDSIAVSEFSVRF